MSLLVEKKNNFETKGVKTLLGDPKKAIVRLAIPMIIAMSAHTIYNLFDALWVSGLGKDLFTNAEISEIGTGALAAVGFVLPFFMMIMAISNGIGIGGGSAISTNSFPSWPTVRGIWGTSCRAGNSRCWPSAGHS